MAILYRRASFNRTEFALPDAWGLYLSQPPSRAGGGQRKKVKTLGGGNVTQSCPQLRSPGSPNAFTHPADHKALLGASGHGQLTPSSRQTSRQMSRQTSRQASRQVSRQASRAGSRHTSRGGSRHASRGTSRQASRGAPRLEGRQEATGGILKREGTGHQKQQSPEHSQVAWQESEEMRDKLVDIADSLQRNSAKQSEHLGMRQRESPKQLRFGDTSLPSLTPPSSADGQGRSSASRQSKTKLPSVLESSGTQHLDWPIPQRRHDPAESEAWAQNLLENAQRQREEQRRLAPILGTSMRFEDYKARPCTPLDLQAFDETPAKPKEKHAHRKSASSSSVGKINAPRKSLSGKRCSVILPEAATTLFQNKRRKSLPWSMRLNREDGLEAKKSASPSQRKSMQRRKSRSTKSTMKRRTVKRQTVCGIANEARVDFSLERGKTNDLLSFTEDEHHEKAMEIFDRMTDGCSMNMEDVPQALHEIGHRYLSQDWINDIVNEACDGRTKVAWDEFLDVCDIYRARFRQHLMNKFTASDATSDGHLRTVEVAGLLRKIDISPLPGVVPELMKEVTGQDQRIARVSFEGFVQIFDSVIDRSGFSRSEFQRISAAFAYYDNNKDGYLTLSELRLALMWLGFSAEQAAEAEERQMEDSLLHITPMKDLLMIIRDLLAEEMDEISVACTNVRQSLNETVLTDEIGMDDVQKVFEKVGFVNASPEILEYLIEACGYEGKSTLDDDGICVLARKFRFSHGFLPAETLMIEQAYKMHNLIGTGIEVRELEVALRWLGYPSTLARVKGIAEELDVNDTGMLQQQEFLLFVARYRDDDMKMIRRVFEEHVDEDDPLLDASQLKDAFLCLGHMPSSNELAELATGMDEDLGLWEFMGMVDRYRFTARERIRENEGFSDAEVRRLKSQFKRFAPHNSGCIRNTYLSSLIDELFPKIKEHPATHQRAKRMLNAVDENNDGELEFAEFLKLMRTLKKHDDTTRLRKEQNMIRFTGFSKDEAREFHHLFDMYDTDMQHELSFETFRNMINRIIPLKGDAVKELKITMLAVDDDMNRRLDFTEFLYIMRRLQDANFQNINEAVAQIVDKQADMDSKSQVGQSVARRKSI